MSGFVISGNFGDSFESMFIEEAFNRNTKHNLHLAKVAVGDTVVLNDDGLAIAFGSSIGLRHMKTLQMKITNVEFVSDGIYAVDVDNPDINRFMLTDLDFDIVRKAK